MKDLKKLTDECLADLRKLGIEPGKISRVYVDSRATRRWGVCKTKKGSGIFEIGISKFLLGDDVDEQQVKNTIIHELLHTVDGCQDHTGRWKVLAEYVNRCLPEYCVKRTSSEDEKGIERNHKYLIVCTKCGSEIHRDRMSNAVKFPQKYKCAKCGGSLRRVY